MTGDGDEALRFHCLQMAMEIYRRNDVPHMVVENVANNLYRFVKLGESQMSIMMDAAQAGSAPLS